jgi:hypothetical protein
VFADVSKGACEGTAVPATQDHMSEDPNLKTYRTGDRQVSFYCPLQLYLMAVCDARSFSVTAGEERRPLLCRDCILLKLTASDNGVLLLALSLDTV